MRRLAFSALLLAIALGTSGAARSQDSLSDRDGVRLMRLMMTVQANRPFAQSGFGSLADVMQYGKSAFDDPVLNQLDSSGAVLSHVLRITTSPDRKSYEISLTPTASNCGPAWFGNEKNVIYSGKPLGCS
jgi:hypothetical protein